MKKTICALLLSFIILFTTGCDMPEKVGELVRSAKDVVKKPDASVLSKGAGEDETHGDSSTDEKNDAILLEVLAALDQRDEEALKSIFIPYAMDNVEKGNIEAGVDYVFSIYKGTMVEWYRLGQWGDEASRDDSKRERTEDSIYEYRVTTDRGSYRVLIYRARIKDKKRDEDGLYRLAIIPAEEKFSGDYSVESDTSVAGFYLPPK